MKKTERAEDIDMSRLALDESLRTEASAQNSKAAVDDRGSHHPKLYINNSPLVGDSMETIYSETSQYSITPKRFTSRSFFSDEPVEPIEEIQPIDMTIEGLRQDFLFYRDTYSHSSWVSDVHRFGINSHNTAIRESLIQHNETQRKTIKDSGEFNQSKTSNASSQGAYTKFVEHVIPTSFENDLMQHALRYLDEDGHKLVLVDTFPRALRSDTKKGLSLGDIIIPSEDQTLEIHTVLLYKSEETGKILVIDPNNPKFSGHLRHIDENIVVDNSPLDQHKIYIRPEESTIGPAASDYRECIDLSVKLAALLAKDEKVYTDHDQIMSSENVRLLSNNPKIVELDAFDVNNPLRIKQVSDLEKLEHISATLSKHNKDFKREMDQAEIDFKRETEVLKTKFHNTVSQISEKYASSSSELLGQLDQDLSEGYYE